MANSSLEFLIFASEKPINLTHKQEWVIIAFSEVSMVYTLGSVKSPSISQGFKEGNGLEGPENPLPGSLAFSLFLTDTLPSFFPPAC